MDNSTFLSTIAQLSAIFMGFALLTPVYQAIASGLFSGGERYIRAHSFLIKTMILVTRPMILLIYPLLCSLILLTLGHEFTGCFVFKVGNTLFGGIALAFILLYIIKKWYRLRVGDYKIKGRYLFSMDIGLEEVNLNKGIISEALKNVFKTKCFSLSEKITITKEKGGNWVITDEEKRNTYFVRKEDEKLNIYKGRSLPHPLKIAVEWLPIGFLFICLLKWVSDFFTPFSFYQLNASLILLVIGGFLFILGSLGVKLEDGILFEQTDVDDKFYQKTDKFVEDIKRVKSGREEIVKKNWANN